MRRNFTISNPIVTVVGVALFVALSQPAAADTPLTTIRVGTGFAGPLFVTAPPGDTSRLFVVEQNGRIRILSNGSILAPPFLDIRPLVLSSGERGLLGMAFHPDYDSNGQFYVNYSDLNGDTVVARYSVSANPNLADAGSAQSVLFIDQPFINHNGGWLAFGPDEYLYIATGDGGSGCDPGQRAQDITDQLLGKMLRIDVNSDGFPADAIRNYAIPPDNPFVGTNGDDEIWAYGLRNPWRCSFDRATGDLYIADVGQRAWEEINFQPASSTGGENYGWDCMEGTACSEVSDCPVHGCVCNAPGLVPPFHEYSQEGPTSPCSITGGYVYRGSAIPDLQGTYFFADFCSNQIWSLRYDGVTVTEFQDRTAELVPDVGSIATISSFGEGADGELYICDRSGGEIFKIVFRDCNDNGVPDDQDILSGTSQDCQPDGVPDECQLSGTDCNTNAIPDDCEIAAGTSADCNSNGTPDECELEANDCNEDGIPDDCTQVGDVNADGDINLGDYAAYSECMAGPVATTDPSCCLSDLNGDGHTDLADFAELQELLEASP